LHGVGYITEVAAGLAVPVDLNWLVLDHGGDPLGNDGSIRTVGILARPDYIEIAEADRFRAIATAEDGGLVEALKLRPQLALELPGSYDPDVDGLALRQARVAARVEARLSTGGDAAGTEFAEARRAILEALYLESGAGDAAPGLDALRLDFTSAPPDADEDAGAQLDTLAYAAELERRLVDAETVGKAELAEIAAQRSATVLSAVLEIDPALEPRVFAGKPVSVENGEESAVPMEIVLTADAEARAAEETG
jgi:hypothetical protein